MRLYTVQYAAYCTVLGFPVEVNFRKNMQNLAKILFRKIDAESYGKKHFREKTDFFISLD